MRNGVARILEEVKRSTTSGGASENISLVKLMIGAIEAYAEAVNAAVSVGVPA
jgi:hypothetical protein